MHEYEVIFTTGGKTYTERVFASDEEEVRQKVRDNSYPDVVINDLHVVE